jgi:SAM-dependent methyltransferase
MIRLLIYMLKRFAWFKRLNARITYELLAKRIPATEWQFMNYGYMPNDQDPPVPLVAQTALQRFPLYMYHYLATKTDVSGKRLLEVGSGRGGGASHIAQSLKPASYLGMDLAQHAVDLSNKLHGNDTLTFIQGSAESIPLPDNSIDVVINVESCHAYGCVKTFLAEVNRVLIPGGLLLLVDFRSQENMLVLQEQLRATGMNLLEQEDISNNVIHSIEAEDATKRDRINTLIPRRWQKLFQEFAGVAGSRFHTTLKDRSRLYYRFVLQKSIA